MFFSLFNIHFYLVYLFIEQITYIDPNTLSTDQGVYLEADDFFDGRVYELTYCTWINAPNSDGGFSLFSWATSYDNNNFLVLLVSSGIKILVDTGDEGGYSDVKVDSDEWAHICVSWESSGGQLRIYKDGILGYSYDGMDIGEYIRTGGAISTVLEQDGIRETGGTDDMFRGYMAYQHVYERVLTAEEVVDMYEGRWLDDYSLNYDDFLVGSPPSEKVNLADTTFPLDKLPVTTRISLTVDNVDVFEDETADIIHPQYSALIVQYNFTATQTPVVLQATPSGLLLIVLSLYSTLYPRMISTNYYIYII